MATAVWSATNRTNFCLVSVQLYSGSRLKTYSQPRSVCLTKIAVPKICTSGPKTACIWSSRIPVEIAAEVELAKTVI